MPEGKERVPLYLWVSLGVEYYRKGKVSDFVSILEQRLHRADLN